MKDSATIVALVVALTQLVKQLGIPPKFSPLISMALGAGISLVLTEMSVNGAVQGIIFGLMASGLWSAGKVAIPEIGKLAGYK